MYEFQELCSNRLTDTFAYWLLAERRTLPESRLSLETLYRWMACHYDIEEQAVEPAALLSDKKLLKHLQPISPITLAERWTPFTLACNILGDPIVHERGNKSLSPAMAVWNPRWLGACEPEDRSEHPRHFVFLLRLACWLAEECGGRVILVGSPGWSYSSWKDEFYMMNPATALILHKAGYLYTDRIAQ